MASRLHRHVRLVAGMACALLLLALALPAGPVRAAPPLVINCLDSGAGSLRAAIAAAASGDTIAFQAGLNCPSGAGTQITLTSGALTIAQNNLTIDASGHTIVVDGNNASSVFSITGGIAAQPVILKALTIQHGASSTGGGIDNFGAVTVTNSTLTGNSVFAGGGGIANFSGIVTVTNSAFSGNSANAGGGIFNSHTQTGIGGTLTVTNSTFFQNSASGASFGGGGIDNFGGGILTVTNSTFSANSAPGGFGGGIESIGTLTVTNSTFAGNAAGSGSGGGIFSDSSGGSGATLTNVIVATSPTGGDLNGTFGGSNNLIDTASSAGGYTDGTNGNIVGHPALLGTLGSNGGPTQTIPLLPGSPAINAGAAVGSGPAGNPVPATDQRGTPRVGAPDIGAFESAGTTATATATTLASSANPATVGQPVTFTATVTGTGGTPTGSVTFKDGTTTLGTGTLVSGVASFSTSTLAAGSHPITAAYGGDATFATSTAPALAQVVNPTGGPPPTAGLQFFPLPQPVRLLDTRPGATAFRTPGAPLTPNQPLNLPGHFTSNGVTIPPAAQALVGNATVDNTVDAPAGFATLYPSGTALPLASNLNFVPGTVRPNAFTVGLGSDGTFNLLSNTGGHFIVDLTGYYAPPAAGGLFFHPLSAPVRLLDTRPGQSAVVHPGAALAAGQTLPLPGQLASGGITVPSSAKALAGNATVDDGVGAPPGFATLFPGGTALPPTSNLNFVPGTVAPNAFAVGLGGDGSFNLYSNTGGHFIVDVTGYYDTVGAGGLLFYPLAQPVRELDTRAGQSASVHPGVALGAGQTLTLPGSFAFNGVTVPAGAKALVGNATVDDGIGAPPGFATLFPGGTTLPLASNLNYVPGTVAPNAFVVGVGGDGTYNLFSNTGGHFIVDISGYFAAGTGTSAASATKKP